MTEKNIFAYKIFLSLNISDSIFVKIATPPPPPMKKATPSKSWGPTKSPLFENLIRGSTPSRKGAGVHTMMYFMFLLYFLMSWWILNCYNSRRLVFSDIFLGWLCLLYFLALFARKFLYKNFKTFVFTWI